MLTVTAILKLGTRLPLTPTVDTYAKCCLFTPIRALNRVEFLAVMLSILFFKRNNNFRNTRANTQLLGREARHRRILSLLLRSRCISQVSSFSDNVGRPCGRCWELLLKAAPLSKLRVPRQSVRRFRGLVRTRIEQMQNCNISVLSSCLLYPCQLLPTAL